MATHVAFSDCKDMMVAHLITRMTKTHHILSKAKESLSANLTELKKHCASTIDDHYDLGTVSDLRNNRN